MKKAEICVEQRAQILIEALPYIRQFYGKTFVVKYGGKAMEDEAVKRAVLQDIVLLRYVGIIPIVVHGGGPEISEMMRRLGLKPRFVRGMRVTDEETAQIAEMVLAGRIGKELVDQLNRMGALAISLSGKDASLLKVRKIAPEHTGGVDIGLVGEIVSVKTQVLNDLCEKGYIPVVSSIGADDEGRTLNLNADLVTGAIAAALQAEKVIFLTDVPGICRDKSDPSTLISSLTAQEARHLLETGLVDEGMVPKVEGCLRALDGGVPKAHIINGSVPHALLMEIFTDKGIGTMIIPDKGTI
ncbi:MAG: acetylglutamate kinase [Armatimonadetes bacterium]|nr:acetylglutamate kinase [Armatimonadota bacterium]MDW8121124.1 acetylglutamate kinase [Armatimonadota bacterium]